MVFLNKAIPPTHELLRDIRKSVRSNEPPNKEQMQAWYALVKSASKALDERLFIVMTAQSKGWTFAKDLDFYQEGMFMNFKRSVAAHYCEVIRFRR